MEMLLDDNIVNESLLRKNNQKFILNNILNKIIFIIG